METSKALEILSQLKQDLTRLDDGDDLGLDRIRRRAALAFRKTFGDESPYVKQLSEIRFHPSVGPVSDEYERRVWRQGKGQLLNLLAVAEEEMQLLDPPKVAMRGGPDGTRRVFVVHGHDTQLQSEVAATLSKLRLEPIILHEQPNRGRTIIEKFEQASGVAFAVVLLTPDDISTHPEGSAATRAKFMNPEFSGTTIRRESIRWRARQNVLLELGFFLGLLGREKVVVLHKPYPGFEIPSDYSGVLFTSVDETGAWRYRLAKEMRASGLAVDSNLL